MRKRKPGLRRYSRALQPTGLCELEVVQPRRVLTKRHLRNDQRIYDYTWSKGNASRLLFPLLFSSNLGANCQSEKFRQSLVPLLIFLPGPRHTAPFTIYVFCLFPSVTYFSSNGCLTCHIWLKGKVVKFLLVHLKINFNLQMNSHVLL